MLETWVQGLEWEPQISQWNLVNKGCNLGHVNYLGIQLALRRWDVYLILKMGSLSLRVLDSLTPPGFSDVMWKSLWSLWNRFWTFSPNLLLLLSSRRCSSHVLLWFGVLFVSEFFQRTLPHHSKSSSLKKIYFTDIVSSDRSQRTPQKEQMVTFWETNALFKSVFYSKH